MTRISDEKMVDKLIAKQIALWEAQKKAAKEADLKAKEKKEYTFGPYITFSREEGSGGGYIAQAVAEKLGWEVFGKEVVEHLSKKAQYRRSVVETLDEHSRDRIADWMTHLLDHDFLGHHTYVKNLMEVVTAVAHHGNVIFIGRGVNFFLPWNKGLHIRVIAPLKQRIERLIKDQNLGATEAEKFVRQSDADRAAFVRMYFHKDVASPHHYDMVINTATLSPEAAIDLVVRALKAKLG